MMMLTCVDFLLSVPGTMLSTLVVIESSQFSRVDSVILILKMRRSREVNRLLKVTQQERSRARPRTQACTQPPAWIRPNGRAVGNRGPRWLQVALRLGTSGGDLSPASQLSSHLSGQLNPVPS